MPWFDWLSVLRQTGRANRRDIRIRKRTHQQWPSPIVQIERMESRVVLAALDAIQNDIGNSSTAFAALAKYRMYRRQGMEMTLYTDGKELARKNVALLVVRARFGGLVVDGNAFATTTDAQS